MNKVASYVKNVGKSVIYAGSKEAEEIAQSTYSFVDSNKELFKDIYSAAKDYKKTINTGKSIVKSSKLFEAADIGVKAAIEDAKSGNWYNVARGEAFADSAADNMFDDGDFGEDFDFNFDDDDFGEGSVPITKGDMMVSSSINSAAKQSTALTSNTIIKTGRAIIESNKASTGALYAQNQQLMSNLRVDINSMHSSINDIYKFATSTLQTQANNSKTYYETTTGLFQEQNAMMKEMLEMQRNIYKKQEEQPSSSSKSYGDISDAYGMPDITAYMKNITKNFKGMIGPDTDMLSSDMLGGANLFAALVQNPLSWMPTTIVKSLIPKSLAVASKNLDKSLSGAFGTMIARLNGMAKDEFSEGSGILAQIGKLLGIATDNKNQIDVKDYEKGAVPFDGITRKSIIEVIPGHLAKIESILSGQAERTFDYDRGQWLDTTDLKKQFQEMSDSYISSAFSSIKSGMNDYMAELSKQKNFNSADRKNTEKDFAKIMRQIYKNDGNFNPNKYDDLDYDVDDPQSLEMFAKMFSGLNRGDQLQLAGNVMNQKTNQSRDFKKMEKSGSSIYRLLNTNANYNNHLSINSDFDKDIVTKNNAGFGGNGAIDEFNNNTLDYLRDMTSTLTYIRQNGILTYSMNVGGKRGKSSKGDPRPQYNDSYTRKGSRINKDLEYAQNSYYNEMDDRDNSKDDNLLDDAVYSRVKQNRTEDEASEFDGYGDTFINKMFKKAKIKSDDISDKNEGTGWVAKFLNAKGIKQKMSSISSFLLDYTSKPASILTGLVEKADLSIYNLLFQKETNTEDKEGRKIKGLINAMIQKTEIGISTMIDNIKTNILDPIEEKYGLNDKFSKLKGKLKDTVNDEGNFIGKTWSEMKRLAGKGKDYTVNSVKDVYDPVYKGATQAFMTADQRNAKNGYSTLAEMLRDKEVNIKSRSLMKQLGIGRNDWKKIRKEKTLDPNNINYRLSNMTLAQRREQKTKSSNQEAGGESSSDGSDPDVQTNYDGIGYVKKSGLTAISKGEAIIPSELNPFNPDRNKTNKRKEIANERKIKSDFTDYLYDNIEENAKGTIPEKYRAAIDKAGTYTDGIGIKISQGAEKAFDNAYGKIKSQLDITDEDKKKLSDVTGDAFKNFKDKGPAVVAKSLIGAGVGLASGLVGGPLIGAGVGAAIGIIQRSDSLKNYLFGEVGEDGERKGGKFLSQETQKVIKQYLPDMGKFGVAGAVTGLITPLGPIGGLMVGSAVGFVKNNDRIHEALFGEENGLINSDRQKAIKKAYPNIAVGALAGIIGGPFGLMGNALIGSAIGMATSSDEFKGLIFGEEDSDGNRFGGLVGSIRESVIDPLKEFAKTMTTRVEDFIINDMIDPLRESIDPFVTEMKRAVMALPKMLTRTISDKIGTPLGNFIKEKFIEPGAKLFKNMFNIAMKPAKFALSAPSKLIGAVGKNLKAKQIVQGRADYMSAEDRNDWRLEHKGRIGRYKASIFNRGDKYEELDQTLANMDGDDVNKVYDTLNTYKSGDKYLEKQQGKKQKEIFNQVDSIFGHKGGFLKKSDRKKILDAISKNKLGEAQKIIQKAKDKNGHTLDQDDIDKINDMLGKSESELIDIKNRRKNLTKTGEQPLLDQLKKLGIKDLSKKNIDKYIKYFNAEKKFRLNAKGDDEIPDASKTVMDASAQASAAIVSKLDEVVNAIKSISDLNDSKGITDEQRSDKDKIFDKAEKQAKKGNKLRGKKTSDRIKILERYGYKDALKDADTKKALSKTSDKTFDLIVSAAKMGHPFSASDLSQILGIDDEMSLNRLSQVTKHTAIPSGSLDKFVGTKGSKGPRDKVFARLLSGVEGDVDLFNEDGTLNEEVYMNLVDTKTNLKFTDKKDNPQNKFSTNIGNRLRGAKDKISNFATGHLSETKYDYIEKFKSLGLIPDYISESEFFQMSINKIKQISKNPRSFKELKQKENSDSESASTSNKKESQSGLEKVKTVFTEWGPVKWILGRDGSYNKADDSGTNDTEKKQQAAQTTQVGILSGLSGLKDSISGFFHKGDKDDDGEKEPWYKKLLGGLFGSKAGIAVAGVGGLGLIGLVKKWWDTSADDSPVKVLVENVSTTIGGVWENKILPWLSGSGDYKGEGLPGLIGGAIPYIAQGAQLIITEGLPILAKLLVSTAPKIIKGAVDGVISIFQNWDWHAILTGESSTTKFGKANDTTDAESGEIKLPAIKNISELFKYNNKGNFEYGLDMSNSPSSDSSIQLDSTSGASSDSKSSSTMTDDISRKTSEGASNIKNPNKYGEESRTAEDIGLSKDAKFYTLDENGNKTELSADEVATGNYNEFYNSEGQKITKNSDGTFNTEEETSFSNSLEGRTLTAATRSLLTGNKTNYATKAVAGIGKKISSGKGFKILRKPLGYALQGVDALNSGAVGLNKKIVGGLGKVSRINDEKGAQNVVDNLLNKTGEGYKPNFVMVDAADNVADDAIEAATKAAGKVASEGVEAGAKKTTKSAISKYITETASKTKAGQKATEIAGKVKDKTGEIAKFIDTVKACFKKFFGKEDGIIAKIEGLVGKFIDKAKTSKFCQGLIKFGEATLEKLLKILPDRALKALPKIAANLVTLMTVIVPVGLAITDVTTGFIDGNGILGVEDASFFERVLGAILRALSNRFLCGLITADEIISLTSGLFSTFGICENFTKRRAAAKAACEKWNTEQGVHLSVYEYLTKDNITTKISNFFDDVGEGIGNFAESVGEGINDFGNSALEFFGFKEKDDDKKEKPSGAASVGALSKIKGIGGSLSEIVKKSVSDTKNISYNAEGNAILPYTQTATTINDEFSTIQDTATTGLGTINDSMVSAMSLIDKKFGLMLGFVDENGNTIPLSKASKMSWSSLEKTIKKTSEKENKTGASKLTTGLLGAANIMKNSVASLSARGTGSKYLSQLDPSISNIGFNVNGDSTRQTIGDSGCGPIAARNILNSYTGRGTGSDIKEAANFAIQGGYKEVNGGTTPDYFTDYLGQYGISTNPTDDIKSLGNNIASGKPTVLMGTDTRGKGKTPFGKNSAHYVVANGMDGKGNVYIQDPESKSPITKYKAKDVLSNTQLGIATGYGGHGKQTKRLMDRVRSKYKFLGFGKGNVDDIINQDLGKWSSLTAADINTYIAKAAGSNRGFSGKGSYFVKAANESGLDPRYILAHAAVETGWGDSNLAKAGNFFGIGAYDSNPNNGFKYGNDSMESGLVNGAKWIRTNYYDAGQTTLYEMQHPANGWHIYATSDTWAEQIASIMAGLPANSKAVYHEGGDSSDSIGSTGSTEKESIFGHLDGISSILGEAQTKYIDAGFNQFSSSVTDAYGGQDLLDSIFGGGQTEDSGEGGSSTETGSSFTGASKTARQFRDKYMGQDKDVDGAYGAQCVDLWKLFTQEVLGSTGSLTIPGGGAKDITNQFDQMGLSKYYDKVSLKDAKYGDWLVWDGSTGGGYGHVAMYAGSDGNNVKAFGQNQGAPRGAANEISMTTNGITSVLRPRINDGESSGYGTKVKGLPNKNVYTGQQDISSRDIVSKRNLTSIISDRSKFKAPTLESMGYTSASKKQLLSGRGTRVTDFTSDTVLRTPSSNINTPTTTSGDNKYDQLLATIIQALLSIVDNTSNLSKIVELLSTKLGIDVDETQIDKTKNSSAQIKQNLLNAAKNNGGSKNGFGNIFMEKDNSYLITAMNTIAKQ